MIAGDLSALAAGASVGHATDVSLQERPFCGLLQTIRSLVPGATARCQRCNSVLRRVRADPILTPPALSIAVTPKGPDTRAQVAAMSKPLAAFADALATLVRK